MANYGYGNGLVGAPTTFATWTLKFIVSIVAAILAVLSLLLALFFLLLRWFMIWMAYIGTPFFAVVWFVGRGPFKSVGSVGATFMRMGVFALLAGPIIAIIVLAFQVIEHGGILQATGGSSESAGAMIQNVAGETGLIFAELALMLLFPVVLIVAIWKLISWAGQPIGVGEAAAVATMAVTAAVGGAVAGATGGAAAGGSGGAASGGASGGASSGSAAGGSSAAASGSGASAGTAGSANVGAGGSGLSSRMTARAKGAVSSVKQSAHQQATKRIGHYGTSGKLDSAQASLSEAQTDHKTASSQARFIQNAMVNEEMDMAEAKKQGFLDAEPMENQMPEFKTDPDTLDRKMTYMGTDGASRSVNLSRKFRAAKADQQDASERITTAESDIAKNAARNRRVETGKKGVRTGKKAGTITAKTGAAAMIGGVGGNSYLAYSAGRRAGGPMIGSNGSEFGKAAGGQSKPPKPDDGNGPEV
ncbi:hypothetical protein N0B31_22435 (plasmid) [Salinirubellus salinus]|uniref:Uncharacterized protein n=1 Tax=Salinirubellus salinus TaxID=1364945 RepID=A0A9E7R7L2_9EURY|nr:hypothetical protein [Salinirubellus salinus]UWM57007.1 hypothetical protein N0B31_22435 [Salinirubellus salinus]